MGHTQIDLAERLPRVATEPERLVAKKRKGSRLSLWSGPKFHFFSSQRFFCRCDRCIRKFRYGVQESIKSNLSINWVLADLMEKKPPMRAQITASYDLIIMFRFVSNDLLESLESMLAPTEC